ncbi:MAG: nucleotidyl transferase AbiEii/AbiGii toxin family protein [Microgenomates group bacterium]
MFKNILSTQQLELLPLMKQFSSQFGLVGGTAIALQIGHRSSIDFDLFTFGSFDHDLVRDTVRNHFPIKKTLIENPNELTILTNKVKVTFYSYPFKISFDQRFDDIISLPSLLTLATMKAFALNRRAKWKDYVDLFFIFKHYTLQDVVNAATTIFGDEFNQKLFREQLSFFEDIDYTESIEYLEGFAIPDEMIKQELQQISLSKS